MYKQYASKRLKQCRKDFLLTSVVKISLHSYTPFINVFHLTFLVTLLLRGSGALFR